MWAETALSIVNKFGALIVPLYDKGQPGTKLNPNKSSNKDLPPNRLPSSDPDIIRKWAEYFPGYGVVPSNNFLILDVDIKEGQNGKKSLKFLKDNGLPTETFAVRSPSGGLHLYYNPPKHYTPSSTTGAFIQVAFEDERVQSAWDLLQEESGCESIGLDIRWGWAYAVGPNCNLGSYTIVGRYDKLASIPATMSIGYKSVSIRAQHKTRKSEEEEILPGSISKDRNNHATQRTYRLAKQGLDDIHAKAIVRSYVEAYDNSDGEAPTYEEIWDMYLRAKEKVSEQSFEQGQDVVQTLINSLIFITNGKRVLDLRYMNTYAFDDIIMEYENQFVYAGDKPVNPVKLWMKSPERVSVRRIIFDIRYPHGLIDTITGEPCFNSFEPPRIFSARDVEKTILGERMYSACLKTIQNIVPDKEERTYFEAWIALLFLEPTHRLVWHWHIYSDVHGVGKDAIADMITALYGPNNVKRMSPSVFLDRTNTDLYNTGLAIMSDFNGLKKKGEVIQRYKELTGTETGRERKLYTEASQSSISVRFLMLTNHEADFPVEKQDRRTFKSHCPSGRLPEELGGLVKAFSGQKVNPSVAARYHIDNVTQKDIDYCKGLLYDYFKTTKYKELPHDCPENKTKMESLIMDAPVYVEGIERLLKMKVYTLASDIITEESIRIVCQILNIKTSIGHVLTTLLENGYIKRIDVYKSKQDPSKGTLHKHLNMPGLTYDAELDTIYPTGEKFQQKCFAVRNFEKYIPIEGRNNGLIPKEYKKIWGVPNISKGYSEKAAEMVKQNKIISLFDDDSE